MATFSMAGVVQLSPKLVDGTFSWTNSVANQLTLANGTASGQADAYWDGQLSIASGATATLDLLSLAFSGLGATGTVALASVKMLAVVNSSANVAITAEPGASNGWDQWGATEIGKSGSVVMFSPVAGLPVGATSKTIKLTNNGTVTTLTGNTTSASAVVSNLSSTTGLAAGMAVSGTGIPSGAKILSVTNATSVTLTANATANGTGVSLAFQWPAAVVGVYVAGIAD